MVVAWITNHLKNGFFIFRPGEGYEYVMTLTTAGLFFCGAGGGRISLDYVLDIDRMDWPVAAGCAAAGLLGAFTLPAVFWRPATPGRGKVPAA